MALHDILKGKRIELELGAKELSIRAQLDPSLVTRFEKGERIPTEAQLERLAQALYFDYHSLRKIWLCSQIEKVLSGEDEEFQKEVLLELLGDSWQKKKEEEDTDLVDRILKLDQSFQKSKKLHTTEWKQVSNLQLFRYLSSLSGLFQFNFSPDEIQAVLVDGQTISSKGFKDHLVLHGLYQVFEKFTRGNKAAFNQLSEILDSETFQFLTQLNDQSKGKWKLNENLIQNTKTLFKMNQEPIRHNWMPLFILNLHLFKFGYPVLEIGREDKPELNLIFRAIKKRLAQSLDEIES